MLTSDSKRTVAVVLLAELAELAEQDGAAARHLAAQLRDVNGANAAVAAAAAELLEQLAT